MTTMTAREFYRSRCGDRPDVISFSVAMELAESYAQYRAQHLATPDAPQISLSAAAGIARKTWQEKYGNCSMCDAGDRPEWSPYAKVFIHRHDRLDRRCGNNPASTMEPQPLGDSKCR